MDPPRFKLDLNGLRPNVNAGNDPDRTFSTTDSRVYPTTPSTFPHSVMSPTGQVDHPMSEQQSINGFSTQSQGLAGYFQPSNTFQPRPPPQFQQTSQPVQQQQQQYNTYSNQDPNGGLARQFQNQNLDPNQRQQQYYPRQPMQGVQYGQQPTSRLAQPALANTQPNAPNQSFGSPVENAPPVQNPDKYPDSIKKRIVGLHVHVEAFFKESVARARDRNVRSIAMQEKINNPAFPRQEAELEAKKLWQQETEFLRKLRAIESPHNFSVHKVIGKGAFGEVKLVSRKSDGKIYALKCLIKAEMFKRDQLAHVRAERDILAESNSEWVVKLHASFQDQTFLYMLMEFLPGGDLMTMLIKYETFSPDVARFYMAEILCAIEAVHKLGFIHRDLKPDNILLDRDGHLKLTDFGLSTGFHKQHEASYYQQLLRANTSRRENRMSVNLDQINLTVSNRGMINKWRQSRRQMAYSTVGTPDYIAPEIFSGQGYTFSCDWWSLGAIMYESVVGWPPFCAEDANETYRKIVHWRQNLYFPEDMPPLDPRASSLITGLLCDAPNRLGTAGGAQELKDHPYFENVDWNNLRSMNAPFRPSLRSNFDVTYFPIDEIPQEDTTEKWQREARALAVDHEAEMTLPFIGYTFKRF